MNEIVIIQQNAISDTSQLLIYKCAIKTKSNKTTIIKGMQHSSSMALSYIF